MGINNITTPVVQFFDFVNNISGSGVLKLPRKGPVIGSLFAFFQIQKTPLILGFFLFQSNNKQFSCKNQQRTGGLW
jgi:hypothetical protein